MNDRFLYRAICNDGKFHHGYLARLYKDDGYGKKGDFCISNSAFCPYAYLVTRPETIGQCTGLKDKNGKLIFEGDIIRHPHFDNAKVEWNDFHACFMLVFSDSDNREFGEIDMDSKLFEVIGNIHENPDLLENKE